MLSTMQALVYVKDGDLERAKKLVYASYVCSLGGVVLFALTLLLLVCTPIAYVRIAYMSD